MSELSSSCFNIIDNVNAILTIIRYTHSILRYHHPYPNSVSLTLRMSSSCVICFASFTSMINIDIFFYVTIMAQNNNEDSCCQYCHHRHLHYPSLPFLVPLVIHIVQTFCNRRLSQCRKYKAAIAFTTIVMHASILAISKCHGYPAKNVHTYIYT